MLTLMAVPACQWQERAVSVYPETGRQQWYCLASDDNQWRCVEFEEYELGLDVLRSEEPERITDDSKAITIVPTTTLEQSDVDSDLDSALSLP